VIFCSFGDMLRVPEQNRICFRSRHGRRCAGGLFSTGCGGTGGEHPDREVVFSELVLRPRSGQRDERSPGETARPQEFSVLVRMCWCRRRLKPFCNRPATGYRFLLAGHVCSVMGYWEYPPIAEKYGVPLVSPALNRSISRWHSADCHFNWRRAVTRLRMRTVAWLRSREIARRKNC